MERETLEQYQALVLSEIGNSMKAHRYAELFPAMNQPELGELAADIKQHGLRAPIMLSRGGDILDGRSRHAACLMVGVTPTFETFSGPEGEQLGYVVSQNLHRRHLSAAQRSMLATTLADEFASQAQVVKHVNASSGKRGKRSSKVEHVPPEQPSRKSRDRAGASVGVSGRSVDIARKIKKKAIPEIIRAVETGELALRAAVIVAELPKAEQQKIFADGGVAGLVKASRAERVVEEVQIADPVEIQKAESPKWLMSVDDHDAESFMRLWLEHHAEQDRPAVLLKLVNSLLPCVKFSIEEPVAAEPEFRLVPPGPVSSSKRKSKKPPVESTEEEFLQFYVEFPRRVNKVKAREAFRKAYSFLRDRMSGDQVMDVLMKGVRVYAERCDPEAICHPATWLNGHRWEDDPAGIGRVVQRSPASQRGEQAARLGAFDKDKIDKEGAAW